MKSIVTTFGILILSIIVLIEQPVIAQAPERMSYQAVIRDNANVLIKNQQIGMRITISDGNTPVYVETQLASTVVPIEYSGQSKHIATHHLTTSVHCLSMQGAHVATCPAGFGW
jgi:hypothetical protein